MSGNAMHRATIPPVPAVESRPLWSVMIPTYNCARHLRVALQSVLGQDPGPEEMQIEVVDDHSTLDDPEAVVAELGGRRVGFYRQAENLGITRNFETCLRRARGRLVHLLHGDDYVRDGFYRTMQRAFEAKPEIGAGFCRQIFADSDGHWLTISRLEQRQSGILIDGLQRLATEQRIMTPAIVARRDVYEELGGFDRRLICSEDWEMWVRIASRYPIWYEVEPLAVYRVHMDSNTGRHTHTAEDMGYTRMAIEIFRSYLPEDIAESTTRKARETYALAAIDGARAMLANRDVAGMAAQLRESLRLRLSPRVMWRVTRFLFQALVFMARQQVRVAAAQR